MLTIHFLPIALNRTQLIVNREQLLQSERLASMGEVLMQISNEIKEMNKEKEQSLEVEREKIKYFFKKYEKREPLWREISDLLICEGANADKNIRNVPADDLKIPEEKSEYSTILSSILKKISSVKVDKKDLVKIWDCVLDMSEDEITEVQSLLSMIGFFTEVDISTKRSYEIIESVLNINSYDKQIKTCNLKSVVKQL